MTLFDEQNQEFLPRHIGTLGSESSMLRILGLEQMDQVVDRTIPREIRLDRDLDLPEAVSEAELLRELKDLSLKNRVCRSYIGQGYYDTFTPSVIRRNLFENPGWYTPYTPYQAEISQGRLESLLNFQTLVSDLTALPLANASLLDEATSAAEAMSMLFHHARVDKGPGPNRFLVDQEIFPQTLDVLLTRAAPLGIEIVRGKAGETPMDPSYFGALVQYPDNQGSLKDYRRFIQEVHRLSAGVIMATDLLALTLIVPPGELGADVAVGSAQRFGVPLGYGGPHAAFFACKEVFKRGMPGRIIGVSVDARGNRALRMALQTREQHIKREKATSNICTAQALLANMAAMYAVYHGPDGLKKIARRVALLSHALAGGLKDLGYEVLGESGFDTLTLRVSDPDSLRSISEQQGMNFRFPGEGLLGISLDETSRPSDVLDILYVCSLARGGSQARLTLDLASDSSRIPPALKRSSLFLQQQVFNSYHSETRMMRYLKHLEGMDLALNTSLITLGSCTMKLNAATQMIPLSWEHWARIHPFAPADQTEGYRQLLSGLLSMLSTITGFPQASFQPNSGAQGEFAGLMTLRNYFRDRGESSRTIILIPLSAHGTNPASAVMAGMQVVVVRTLPNGYIDMEDFRAKAGQYSDRLAGTMITYPSTYGIFEESVREICGIVHRHGGQVYLDGANMNAQVGLTSPALIGADICHLNLHKTFAIPHGGGGPGMGPIFCREHLGPYLPGHSRGQDSLPFQGSGAVTSTPYGSASILLISYAYLRLLGRQGLPRASEYAILNAQYMKARLEGEFPILFTGSSGSCAHEFILDLRPFKTSAGIEAEDIAKRLMDYGFHAPTLSFPVPGTFMIEPTESEDQAEMDRFCQALISIRREIGSIESGQMDPSDNPLKNAPHTAAVLMDENWTHSYSREQACFPLEFVRHHKFWPSVARINNTQGDRQLICTCEPLSSYA